ncbi:MAG: NUDIX hydrolase [Flavobacteriales bacterium]|nr:NUDIX hydrolase [Flavobacteriales bacterium]
MQKKNVSELNPNVSVDCVIFGFDLEKLNVLVIDRGENELAENVRLALPGNLIYNNENLEQAAYRVLEELTSLKDIYLEQIGAFGDPNRICKEADRAWLKSIRAEPEARVITVAYFSLVKMEDYMPHAASFAKNAAWIPADEIKDLAFDHYDILQAARNKLKEKIKIQPIGFNLLPEKFTLSQLHKLYESILDKELDKRNFRRKVQKLDILTNLNEKQEGVPHKPSELYKFNEEKYQELTQNGYDNFGF